MPLTTTTKYWVSSQESFEVFSKQNSDGLVALGIEENDKVVLKFSAYHKDVIEESTAKLIKFLGLALQDLKGDPNAPT